MSGEHTVQIIELPPGQVKIPITAVHRYLGLRGTTPEAELAALIAEGVETVGRTARFRACRMVLPIRETDEGVDFGAFFAPGRGLARNLSGCEKAILFAATIGVETELQGKRAAISSPARALILDAAGTAAVEAFCDVLCTRWRAEFAPCVLRPRFSPGYGDLPLELQKPLLACLDSGRRAGITLTDALLMVPQKSVSAIVGIGREGCAAQGHDCTQCDKLDCAFRL